VAANIFDRLDRELRVLARVRSMGKRSEERLAVLIKELRSQDGGQPRCLPEPPVNDVVEDDELVELVTRGMREAGYVPKLRKR
jgi:hypothetical protein